MPDHARQRQTLRRAPLHAQIMAVRIIRVGEDRAAGNLVERDVLSAEFGRRGNDDTVAQPLGIAQRPAHGLHAAETAADHRRPAVDAEPVGETGLGLDPVADLRLRELWPPGLAS